MNCSEIQKQIDEGVTIAGLEISPEIQTHLESCPGCHAYAGQLEVLATTLEPLSQIMLTGEEVTLIEAGLNRRIDEAPVVRGFSFRLRLVTVPLAVAAAVILLFMFWSPANHWIETPTFTSIDDEWSLDAISSEDVMTTLSNGNGDLLPSFIDTKTAAYLTGQMEPGQADDILDGVSDAEMEWLEKNLSLEI